MRTDSSDFPAYGPDLGGHVLALAAAAGPARRQALAAWADSARERGADVSMVSCDLARGGIWAGLNDLLREVLPQISRDNPDLVERHTYEITTVLPELRQKLQVQHVPLTESVRADEKVRSYPMDRAYRIVQGLIDMFTSLRQGRGAGPWVLVCDDFDAAGFLVSRFFRELVRRRGQDLGLTLVLGVAAEAGESTLASFHPKVPRSLVRLDLPAGRDLPSPQEQAERAREIESQMGSDLVQIEMHLPQLIDCWSKSDQPENALRWKAMAFAVYNHYGFYEDALIYAEAILPEIDRVAVLDHRFSRWQIIGGLYNSYVSAGRIHDAYKIMEEEALGKIDNPSDLARAYYIMSMLHARFLPERDLAKAEGYIDRALAELAKSDEPASDRHFFTVFLWNGLAYIRHRQGRPEEAIALCRHGFDHLDEHLSPEEHRLHRSVLLYNMGQVFESMGAFQEAVRYFTEALKVDPNYSEYYNDRGNVYLKMGELDAAISDYLQAIALSPPYHEVWTNLGQACKLKGSWREAAEAFSRAIDLMPDRPLLLLGRAQAYESLGEAGQARADYAAALELDPGQPMAWSNLAVLQYEAGEIPEAVQSLDAAIRFAPEIADLYTNRAFALEALGRFDEAAKDLEKYLEIHSEAEDREEIESRLRKLAVVG